MYNNNRDNRYSGRGGNWGQTSQPELVKPKELPEDAIDQAEAIMSRLSRENNLSTSKLRNILSMISDIYTLNSRILRLISI